MTPPPDAPSSETEVSAALQSDPGWRRARESPSLEEVHRSIPVHGLSFWRKLLAFAGPGYLVAVGYMDPGNWATDLAGGSQFGYALLSVILISNLMAVVLQGLASKLGIVTGRDLAQACRDHYSKPVALALWVLCEIAIAACDLAEVIGTAIALNLLFNIPLSWGVAITALDVLLVLYLQNKGFRFLEALVIALVVVVGACFLFEIIVSGPDMAASRGLHPHDRDPHQPADALHRHRYPRCDGDAAQPLPALVDRADARTGVAEGKREAVRFAFVDSTIALSIALFINAAILIVAAATFHTTGNTEVAEIQDAYKLLSPLLGVGAASTVFALALLASGQTSTITGTLAGQIVMEGFLNIRMRPWLRRLLTRGIAIVPAAITAILYGESGTAKLLILSQVILSLQLSFAVFPLVMFTSDKLKMGEFANPSRLPRPCDRGDHRALNIWLLVQTVVSDPLMYQRILVPLEHTSTDDCILEHVRRLARHSGASIVIIHVADGWAARNLAALNLRESEEMRDDREYIERVAHDLNADGIRAEAVLANGEPAREITSAPCARGATHRHGHAWTQVHRRRDPWERGEAVRHDTFIPVLLLRAPGGGNEPRPVTAL
jgi:manganese transport protein